MKINTSPSNPSSFSKKFITFNVIIIIIVLINGTIYSKCTATQIPNIISVPPKSIKGNALIIDGDSIKISDVIIRLSGIDAPELNQFCGIKKERYACGFQAKKNLEKLIDNQSVTCHWSKKDKYHRILAICGTKQVNNINAAMVRSGWAISFYSYHKEEQEAKKQKKGIWRSSFQKPQEWRKVHSPVKK
ncbi:Staphylococcal nuclease homolog [Bartonella clarridgeiae 73]|uniref:Staphylococcal nuclease homolog n=1 Tax=Bartonella clarridgeiae (strain CCUG 45776 / CIP 104772 / 73) TaxID=696125 RepID=E6YHZ1_BARC7|nr:thermonuclease family protein [Bartonella clarridgeiae]WCR54945.1 MAG: Nuclease [Bartonella clarridgeiae]CBI76479.1 Staphylococcal nuclease homolog [Bartonella clarridgeiae 73]